MPSSRPVQTGARTRARVRAAVPARKCQALLTDEETRCSSHASGRGRYCVTHGKEYAQLTRAYKAASNHVNALEPEIQHAEARADVLESSAAVDGAIALVDQFLAALGEEISRRTGHHKRFFQVVDQNHQKWLIRQRGQEAGAVRLLERLRRRKEEVVTVEEAKKRDEHLRAIEEVHRTTIAETHRRAIEDAQCCATEEARRRAIEDAQLMDIAEAQRKATQQLGSVLSERTNVVDVGPKPVETVAIAEWVPKPPPKDRLSVVLPPRPYQPPQFPPTMAYHGARQGSREPQTPMPPARAPAPMRPNSFLPVDIERQGPPAVRSRPGWQVRTEEGTERTTLCDMDLLDCMRTALFWVATFFVFCYLVVVESLNRGYRLVVG